MTPAVPTVVFIPGNRTDADDAVTKGWYVYRVDPVATGRPAVALRDLVVARRSRVPPQSPRRPTEGRLQRRGKLLSGPVARPSSAGRQGEPRSATVSDRGSSPAPCTCWPAAKWRAEACPTTPWPPGPPESETRFGPCCWPRRWTPTALAPGGRHGLALSLVDRMLVTRNGCDRVLRWYPRMYGRGGPGGPGVRRSLRRRRRGERRRGRRERHGGQGPRLCAATARTPKQSCAVRLWRQYTFLDERTACQVHPA